MSGKSNYYVEQKYRSGYPVPKNRILTLAMAGGDHLLHTCRSLRSASYKRIMKMTSLEEMYKQSIFKQVFLSLF